MKPLVLSIEAKVRVSYLASKTVRQQVKVSIIKAYSPTYTGEVYMVTDRRLAPGSRRVVLYDLVAADRTLLDGQQGGTRLGNLVVRLPLELVGIDRRYLQPLPSEGSVPRLADRFPGLQYAFRIMPKAAGVGQAHADDIGDFEGDYDDLDTAAS